MSSEGREYFVVRESGGKVLCEGEGNYLGEFKGLARDDKMYQVYKFDVYATGLRIFRHLECPVNENGGEGFKSTNHEEVIIDGAETRSALVKFITENFGEEMRKGVQGVGNWDKLTGSGD